MDLTRGRPPALSPCGVCICCLLTGLLTLDGGRWFFSAVVCAGGELPGAGPDQYALFSNTAPRDDPLARSVINEAELPWRALFLNLNYHAGASLICQGSPGTLYVNCICIARRHSQRNQGFLVRAGT